MSAFFDQPNDAVIKMASKVYGKVIHQIQDAWQTALGEELVVNGQVPTARFEDVIGQLKKRLRVMADRSKLVDALDVDAGASAEEIVTTLVGATTDDGRITSVDDLTPNQVLSAIREIAAEMSSDDGKIDVGMPDFLRAVLARVFKTHSLPGRLNVGKNRHFHRLYQWLKEFEAETDWDDGQGFRIKNAAGRGPVRAEPTDPQTLKITIDREFL